MEIQTSSTIAHVLPIGITGSIMAVTVIRDNCLKNWKNVVVDRRLVRIIA